MTISYWKGLRPLKSFAGNNHSFPTENYQAAAGNALYTGQVVTLNSSGLVEPMANSDTTVVPLGVIAGLFYPTDGRPVNTDSVTAAENAVTTAYFYQGIDFEVSSGVGVMVYVDPTIVYGVIANETIVQADIGDLVRLVSNTAEVGAQIQHTGAVGVADGNAATAGGIFRLVNVPRTNIVPGTYSTTNITDDSGLINRVGSGTNPLVAVTFEFSQFKNPQLPELA
jgi:hypothetical protein